MSAVVGGDDDLDVKGKDREGHAADFEGFLKKRGDQGRLKVGLCWY